MSQRDKATLEALIQSRAGAGWRLIPPANYHLTLCFLGDQLPATLAALAERLRTGPAPPPPLAPFPHARGALCAPPARGAGAFRAAPRRGNCVCRSTNSVCFRVFRRRRAASMSGSTALRSAPMALPPRAGRMVKPAVRWPK
ncbi:MAG: hypothetical protein IPK48_01425 [Gammaproteobacteria bacterium]|nr:hypothetical protein [Gammaproteobacteria bacterium]